MLKLLIPVILITILCLCAGSAGLKLLGIFSIFFAAGAGFFFLFRLFTRKKNQPKRVNKHQEIKKESAEKHSLK